ncbi:hypothetical protein BDY19DRAFT_935100 [Irpex rosettiformis]|uniref:Uncharacterized protein n=1 Tax=Irpex rosettiformis TaxID=378272 RepID=A0ACB8UB85_9APHY|nr:hypothetical protein BDY19DRAFT_935100 [Irpex rosettiformis]
MLNAGRRTQWQNTAYNFSPRNGTYRASSTSHACRAHGGGNSFYMIIVIDRSSAILDDTCAPSWSLQFLDRCRSPRNRARVGLVLPLFHNSTESIPLSVVLEKMWPLPPSLIVLVGLQLSVFVPWGTQGAPVQEGHSGHGSQQATESTSINLEAVEYGRGAFERDDKLTNDIVPSIRFTLPTPAATAIPSRTVKDVSSKEEVFSPANYQNEEMLHINPRQFGTGNTFVPTFPPLSTAHSTASKSLTTSNPFLPTYSFPTYSFPDYTWPTYSYPDYTWPTYSYPDYTWPTYSYPDYTFPTYSYPTPTFDAGGDGGGSSGSNFGGGGGSSFEVPKMKKVNVKTVVGSVVGSVTGFLALVGGIWAGLKRRARDALRRQEQEQQMRETEQRVPFIGGGNASGSGGVSHTPSVSQISSGGGSGMSATGMPHVPQPTMPAGPYVPTQY